MLFLRSIYASLILAGCCVTAAGLSSPSLAGEVDSEFDVAGSVPAPLAYPLLLGLTSGTCLGLMARLNATQRQLLQMQDFTAENTWNPSLHNSIAPEFSETDLNDADLAQFLEAIPEDSAEKVLMSAGLMAECPCS